jgi:hypothetical protein
MKKIVRLVLQKLVLGTVGLACMLTVVPFFLAIIESLAFAKTQSEKSILKTYVAKLFSKEIV